MAKNVYLDTETTDFNPGQIGQLTMISEDTDTGKVLAYNYFFKIDDITEEASRVNGLTVEKSIELSGGKVFEDYYKDILNILQGATIVAHNEAFDEKFISSELWRCGVSFTPYNRCCTMKIFKDILKIPAKYRRYGKYKNPNLEEVLNYLNLDKDKIIEYTNYLFGDSGIGAHDSRYDTTAVYVVVNIYREKLHGGDVWHKRFCLGY